MLNKNKGKQKIIKREVFNEILNINKSNKQKIKESQIIFKIIVE